jgi:hypothetical protein
MEYACNFLCFLTIFEFYNILIIRNGRNNIIQKKTLFSQNISQKYSKLSLRRIKYILVLGINKERTADSKQYKYTQML